MVETLESLETPVHSREKKLVLKAIADSPQKITVADIATKTSLPVLQANSLLNQIAYETGGNMTVGTAGSIVYQFSPNFQSEYLSRSSKNFFARIFRIFYNGLAMFLRVFSLVMFFVVRVSFGIALIASVVLIVALVILAVVALFAKMFANDNDSGGDLDFDFSGLFVGIAHIFRYWAWDWLWDWIYWGSYIRWDPVPSSIPDYQHYPSEQQRLDQAKPKTKESFLDKCFSFLFGEGDPNQGLEQRYWQTVALALRANNGTVVAEQLAPYSIQEGKNEDWMLPILVRFNGNCEVSDSGNIIYTFPSFQQKLELNKENLSKSETPAPDDLQAMFHSYLKKRKLSQSRQVNVSKLENYLKEHHWDFCHVPDGSRMTIVLFAVLIMVGGVYVSTLTNLLPLIALIKPLLYAISAYGAMFLLIPGIRYLVLKKRNEGIERRNSVRFTAANQIQNAGPNLKKKLKEAEQARTLAIEESSKESVAYTTERDALEQEFDKLSDK